MGDWANTAPKVAPGGKAYLFTGPAGNAIDWLTHRATVDVEHVVGLRPPLHPADLGVHTGDSTAIVVRGMERGDEADWELLERFLTPVKIKGTSVVITAIGLPDHDAVRALKAKMGRWKGSAVVDTSSPTGPQGRKDLITWAANDWQTTVLAATRACERTGYDVAALVHAAHAWHAMTSGRPTDGTRALRLVDIAVPQPVEQAAYTLLLTRDPAAVDAATGLDARRTLGLLRALEAALTDLELIQPVLTTGATTRQISDKTGVHIVRVLELAEWAPRYPPGVIARCRQALAIGLADHTQPEAAATVALLWS